MTCWAPAEAYQDLGEGIRNTLVGSCEIQGHARAEGTVGLEHRGRG